MYVFTYMFPIISLAFDFNYCLQCNNMLYYDFKAEY